MRQRITYLRESHEDGFTPEGIVVGKSELSVQGLRGVREWRVTVGFGELDAELTAVLEQCHELHIRWASEHAYTARPPFVSRVAPGLHVFYTPEKGGGKGDLLCPILRKVFDEGIKCNTPEETFSSPSLLSTRFASSASSQYHTLLPSLEKLVGYLQGRIRHTSLSSLLTANYLDIDYDAISHALLITAFWEKAPKGDAWNERIENAGNDRVEVGVLNREKADEKEEVGLGGWLTVIGQNDKPSQTLFSFPSRHHILPDDTPTTFSTTFDQPTGLHPTLRIHIPHNTTNSNLLLHPPAPSGCALHAYLTLPSALFLDRHAFTDPLFLASHNLHLLHTLTGATDLEAPDWAIPQWGSAALFELAIPTTNDENQNATNPARGFTATIPLHTRYLNPSASSSKVNITTPYPHIFWACTAEAGAPGSAKMSVNPFDRVNLGYDGLFGDRTVFHHFSPAPAQAMGRANNGDSGTLTVTLQVPTLNLSRAAWVESGTVAAVAVGVLWVLWKLFGPVGEVANAVDKSNPMDKKKASKQSLQKTT